MVVRLLAAFSLTLAANFFYAEEIAFVAETPAAVVDLDLDYKVGYFYRRYVWLWHTDGQFVFYRNEFNIEYVVLTDQEWRDLLGRPPEAVYSVPWSYRIPPGWWFLGIAGVAAIAARRYSTAGRNPKGLRTLDNLKEDEQLAAGMSHYIQACAEEGLNPFVGHPQLLGESVEFLIDEYEMDAAYAADGLGLLHHHMAELTAIETQESAAQLEADGEWVESRDAYVAAAEIWESIAPDHADFVRRECVTRVERRIDPLQL